MSEFSGQDVCILGGTGTIGTALIERLLQDNPARIRCVSNDEYSLWKTEKKFGAMSHENPLRYVLKDIRNREAMRELLRGVDVLYMLACYKHVQYVEYSPQEAIEVNINGNKTVIEEVLQNARVQKVVNASTDKVCYANNTYGLSKHIVEKLIEWAQFYRPVSEQITKFSNVRFGNVLMSRGSVLEHWFNPETKEIQLRDPFHRRFIMPTREAIDLLLKCTTQMKGGETFIYKMPVVQMGDLAEVVSELTKKPVVRVPVMLGEQEHQWLMTKDESIRRIEDDDSFTIHRNNPFVSPSEYSTENCTLYTKSEIEVMIEEEFGYGCVPRF